MRLNNCPYCGSEFKMSQEPYDNHPVGGKFYIYHVYGDIGSAARNCHIDVRGHFDTEKEAADFWNILPPQREVQFIPNA